MKMKKRGGNTVFN